MSKPVRLGDAEIQQRLTAVPQWRREGDAITRDFTFRDFSEAFAFLSRVALLAERQDHHPELWNVWNRVRLTYSTHDADGVSERDFAAAAAVDRFL